MDQSFLDEIVEFKTIHNWWQHHLSLPSVKLQGTADRHRHAISNQSLLLHINRLDIPAFHHKNIKRSKSNKSTFEPQQWTTWWAQHCQHERWCTPLALAKDTTSSEPALRSYHLLVYRLHPIDSDQPRRTIVDRKSRIHSKDTNCKPPITPASRCLHQQPRVSPLSVPAPLEPLLHSHLLVRGCNDLNYHTAKANVRVVCLYPADSFVLEWIHRDSIFSSRLYMLKPASCYNMSLPRHNTMEFGSDSGIAHQP
jgi:hypothetical protein